MTSRKTFVLAVLAVLTVAATLVATAAALADTSVKDYVVPVGDEYEVDALHSVGDAVPWSGGAGQYRMVGIPDGLGAHPNGDGTSTVYMNSEFPAATLSEPLKEPPRTPSTRRAVSQWRSSTATCTRSRDAAGSPGRTRSCSRIEGTAP